MSWPNEHTHSFYVHTRTCTHCGNDFDGFARSKYCSPRCIEMSKRCTLMTTWGVPTDIIDKLLAGWSADA